MKEKYGFGIVGCGVVAPFHAHAIKMSGRGEIIAVCDQIEGKAASFAQEFGVSKYYTDYRKLVEDKNVDMICVCNISGKHGEVVEYAALNKKHVLCEKPLEITAEKIDKMIKEVRKSGIKMGCVYQMRTLPESIAVKKALSDGTFGRIFLADVYQKFYRSQDYYDNASWRGTWELDGGGALMNQGIHGIDMLLWLAGDVESVFARTAAQARKIVVEDTAVAVLKFKNGAFGVIEGTTSVFPAQDCRLEIHGENGSIIFGDAGIAQWKVEGKEEEKAHEFDREIITSKDDPTKMIDSNHLILMQDFIDAVDNDREPMVTPEEARKAVDLILAIYESARTGKEVKVRNGT